MRAQIGSHYRIIKQLGAGGMGEVDLAEDTRLDRKVAIKFLPAESTNNVSANLRLVREAKSAATLDHFNICAIHEVNQEEDGLLWSRSILRVRLWTAKLKLNLLMFQMILIAQDED